MEKAFDAKAKEVMSGKTTILSTSYSGGPAPNVLDMLAAPGEDTLKKTGVYTLLGVIAGAFFGSVRIAWYPDPEADARGRIIDKTPIRVLVGRALQPALIAGITTGTFMFMKCTAESGRQTKDSWNAVYGGMVAGFILGGITRKRWDQATITALGTGLAMGLTDLSGPGVNWNRSHLIDVENTKRKLPKTYSDSDEVKRLKELYPKFKDL